MLYLLLRQVDFPALINQILKIPFTFLLLGGLIYGVKAVLRAARFARMNARQEGVSLLRMLRLSLASSLASQLLPLKLGELSYVYLLKREYRSPVAQGLSTLMLIRLFDMLAVALLFVAFALLVRLPASLSLYFYSILAFVGLLLALILALLFGARFVEPLLAYLFRFRWVRRVPYLFKLRGMLAGVALDLQRYSPRAYAEWTVLAALEWLVNYFTYHVLLIGIGLQPALFTTVVTVTFAALASVLPINSFGSFGTQEAGWATGLVLLGYRQEVAITSAFAAHLLILGYILLLGGLSWLSYLLRPAAPAPAAPARSDGPAAL